MNKIRINLLTYRPDFTGLRELVWSIVRNTENSFILNLIDGGTEDRSYEDTFMTLQAELGDKVNCVHLPENEGTIASRNRFLGGLAEEYLCLMSDDIAITRPGWDTECVAELSADPKLAEIGIMHNVHNRLSAEGYGEKSGGPPEYIEAAMIFMPSRVVQEVIKRRGSLMDEAYAFAYCEDSDLSLFLRSNGYSIKQLDLGIRHNRQADRSSRLSEHQARNQQIFQHKWQKYLDTKSFD